MPNAVAALREQWEALRLELLVPAKLADADFAALIAGRADPYDQAFRERVPVTVAHFKETAKLAIMEYAKGLSKTTTTSPYREAYCADLGAINGVLFGTAFFLGAANIGFFDRAQVPRLHVDGNEHNATNASDPLYIARLGALPVWYVRNRDEMHGSDETQELIRLARAPGGRVAADELRERAILTAVPLGDVALITTYSSRHMGTLHCSSPVPAEGAHSAFFSAWFRDDPAPRAGQPRAAVKAAETPLPRSFMKRLLRLPPSRP